MHHVEHAQLRVDRGEQRRQDREVLGHVVGDGKGGERATGHQQFLANLHHVQQLGRVAVEVDHVGRFAGSLGAIVHRHAHVSLGQGRGIVGAVAAHSDQTAVVLFVANAREFFLWRGFGEHVIHTSFGSNRSGRQRVVAGDHHSADAQFAQLGETFADAGLDHVLEVDRTEQFAIGTHQQRRTTALGDLVDFPRQRR